ncbi:MAG TPA: hypothetical protein PLM07_01705 [Candidatus Rifleibacterium sp.]|nr:hypothetical protein [Candidatus Rifleibacterium sp.]HPT44594.1 hypothetical protein [Candidatus Rifleibacterium sp.]
MNINNSLSAYRNTLTTNPGTQNSASDETAPLRRANLGDYLQNNSPAQQVGSNSTMERPTEGVLNLQPVARYRYLQNQAGSQNTLDTTGSDPMKTIQQANKIINDAILPPNKDNPDMAELTRAIQIRQMMQGRLDLAA